jgi:3-methyladenine DNA glycosylase AlkD
MPTPKPTKSRKSLAKPRPQTDAKTLLRELEQLGDTRTRDDLQPRYGITAPKAFGVPMAKLQSLAKRLGRDHALAHALWQTGWYEARLLASLIDDPAQVTSAQMDRWCRDFDNWSVVDTACFKLFDRVPTPLALRKIDQWSRRDAPRDQFVKRAGLALLACLALHDDHTLPDEVFASRLPLVERAATDARNFVYKGAAWTLKAIGVRSTPLRAAALALASRLADSSPPGSSSRWVGKESLRALRDRSA